MGKRFGWICVAGVLALAVGVAVFPERAVLAANELLELEVFTWLRLGDDVPGKLGDGDDFSVSYDSSGDVLDVSDESGTLVQLDAALGIYSVKDVRTWGVFKAGTGSVSITQADGKLAGSQIADGTVAEAALDFTRSLGSLSNVDSGVDSAGAGNDGWGILWDHSGSEFILSALPPAAWIDDSFAVWGTGNDYQLGYDSANDRLLLKDSSGFGLMSIEDEGDWAVFTNSGPLVLRKGAGDLYQDFYRTDADSDMKRFRLLWDPGTSRDASELSFWDMADDGGSGSKVGSVDKSGNAYFSGRLKLGSSSIIVSKATGELDGDKIAAGTIEGTALETSGVVAGTYGGNYTVNAQGLITAASSGSASYNDDVYLPFGTDSDFELGYDSTNDRLTFRDGDANALGYFVDGGTTGNFTVTGSSSSASFSATNDITAGGQLIAGSGSVTVTTAAGNVDGAVVDITSATDETSAANDDTILMRDTSAGAQREISRSNFLAGIGGADDMGDVDTEAELESALSDVTDVVTNNDANHAYMIDGAGTSGQRWQSDGSGAGAWVDNVHTLLLLGSGATLKDSWAPEKTQWETTTNVIPYWVLDFDAASDEVAWWTDMQLPIDYTDGTTVKISVTWTGASGSGDVVWAVGAFSAGNDDTLDTTVSTTTVTDTFIAASDCHVTSQATVTIGGTPASGETFVVKVFRDADNGSDTFTADARLVSVSVEYS